MRKILCIIGFLVGCLPVMVGQTATVIHKGTSTFFTGKDAFWNAYQHAAEGDSVLIYSTAYCNDTIRKSIHIIGGGYNATTSISSRYDSVANKTVYPCVQAEHVIFEGLSLSRIYLLDTRHCTFRHCYLYRLDSVPGMGHTNTLVDQCRLYYDYALSRAVNYTIQNSYISSFYSMNTPENMVTITNCMIRYFYHRGESGTAYIKYKQPFAVYRHNVLCLDSYAKDSPEHPFMGDLTFQFKAPSQFYDNYIYLLNSDGSSKADPAYYIYYSFEPGCVNENNTVNLESSSAIRCDSTHNSYEWLPECYGNINYTYPFGPMEGIEFSQYARIPRVISQSASVYTDMAGQWPVVLKVKAERLTKTDDPSVAQIEYWVDDPSGEKQVITLTERPGANDTVRIDYTFDFEALRAGQHTFYYRLKDTNGTYGPLISRTIYRRNIYDNELLLPYDATTLDEDMQTANPTYMAYPTEIESQMPPLQCN